MYQRSANQADVARRPSSFVRISRIIAALTLSAVGVVGAFGISPKGSVAESPEIQSVVQDVLLMPSAVEITGSDNTYWIEGNVERGDTMSTLFSRLGVSAAETRNFVQQMALRRQGIQLSVARSVGVRVDVDGRLLEFVHRGDPTSLRFVRINATSSFVERSLELTRRVEVRSGVVQSSLFGATDQAGIPDGIARIFADIFSNEVDLHRDIRSGDRFSVVYEMLYADNEPIRPGRVLAAEFIVKDRRLSAFYFQRPDGRGDYYSALGKNYRTTFLRSPIEFSRITSGFSSARLHPVLQVWRAHKGIDFGAPVGTKVKATADGKVTFVGWKQGYGRTIELQHAKGYSTLYGHLSGYARGVEVGKQVGQGDVIGYVGMSGLATGPHLHYEFHVNGIHVDPTKYSMSPREDVPHELRESFLGVVQSRQSQLDLIGQFNIVSSE